MDKKGLGMNCKPVHFIWYFPWEANTLFNDFLRQIRLCFLVGMTDSMNSHLKAEPFRAMFMKSGFNKARYICCEHYTNSSVMSGLLLQAPQGKIK